MKKPLINSTIPTEEEFWEFCELVPVSSRDTGVAPIQPWGTQKYLIKQIFNGIQEGQHQFYTLKAGQVGASTVLLLLNLFWYLRVSPGMQGVIVTDSDELREFFRDSLVGMLDGLSGFHAGEQVKSDALSKNNKNMMSFKDGGRLLFQTSGSRTGLRLGVGRGFALAHCSEVALWPMAASLTYLRTRFSDVHPHRLLVLESTARGKNWWYDLWSSGESRADIRRIFLGWWLREDYYLKRDSPEFKRYWDGKITRREKYWIREVKKRFGVSLKPEQLAYKRWYTAEKAGDSEYLSDQEMPTLEEDAFEATGESFLGYELLGEVRKQVKRKNKPECYRYEFGKVLEESEVVKTSYEMSHLRIWEYPLDAEAYIIAAVPAHSSTAACSTGCVSVWKATRECIVQVAEFSSNACGIQTFSWACIHLLGVYRVQRRSFILEVQGHGMGVLQELKRIQDSGWGMRTYDTANARKVIGPIHHYIWRRADSLSGGGALQQKSDDNSRSLLIRRLRDQIENQSVIIKSKPLVEEFERMRQLQDSYGSESEKPEEHRLMACALAVESWAKQIRPLFREVQGPVTSSSVMDRMIQNVFFNIGRGNA